MSFTPGPWAIKFRNDHSAYMSMGDPMKGPHKQFDIEAFNYLDPSDVADARLIAAAPELLAALEDMTRRYVSLVDSGDAGNWEPRLEIEVMNATAAIKKARGEA